MVLKIFCKITIFFSNSQTIWPKSVLLPTIYCSYRFHKPQSNPPEHATYMQDCCLLTPLTPTTDYQQFSEEFTHTNGRTNTHTNTHTKCRTNHSQNVSRQSRKFRGLSQKFHGLSEKSHGLSQMFHGRA